MTQKQKQVEEIEDNRTHTDDNTALALGDITTFDFDIYKYNRPKNFFQTP